MIYESSLTQASQFSDSLSIRPSTTTAEKTADENAQTAKNPEQGGDTISISAEARALIAPQKADDSKEFKGDSENKPSQGQTLHMDNPFNLTPEQGKRADKLFGELDTIFSSGKELTAEQESRVEEIFGELNELFPVEDEFQLTAEEEKRVEALFEQLDKLHANKGMTPEQQKQAASIEKELDSIFMGAEERENGEGGEGVTISNESMAAQSKANKSESKSTEEQAIDRLKEQIQQLKEEIKALEEGDLPEKEKNNQIQAKQAQLMELNDQLLKAQQKQLKANGQSSGGGTRANGFGNSVSSF